MDYSPLMARLITGVLTDAPLAVTTNIAASSLGSSGLPINSLSWLAVYCSLSHAAILRWVFVGGSDIAVSPYSEPDKALALVGYLSTHGLML